MIRKLVLTVPVILFLGGCAVGQTFDYAGTELRVESGTTQHDLALGVLDRRSYILDGSKEPDFIGLSRGGFGNPFDVRTTSGASLSDDVAAALGNALREAGYEVDIITLEPSREVNEVQQTILAGNAERALLLVLTEWKTDTMMRTGLEYDVALTVFDRDGDRLASERISGSEVERASILDAEEQARQWFVDKMNDLLARDSIADALNATP